jgi:hypothetical protein
LTSAALRSSCIVDAVETVDCQRGVAPDKVSTTADPSTDQSGPTGART